MKKLLTTAALVTMVISSITAEATAKTSKNNRNYVSATGTIGKTSAEVKANNQSYKLKSNKDFGGEIAFGHYFTQNIRGELAGGYSKVNAKKSFNTLSEEASRKSLSFMGNTYFDFKNTSPFTPYVMGGIGIGHGKYKVKTIIPGKAVSELGKNKNSFIWQIGAGVDASVADNVKVGLGYRYKYDTAKFSNTAGSAKFKPEHLLLASVRYEF